jgi:hypothetical protein
MNNLWYERDPQLLRDEQRAMNRFFGQFQLMKLSDGKLAWEGSVVPKVLGDHQWYLQVVYDHNHPHNNDYGGSLRVYSIMPDLDELEDEHGSLPHTLHDSKGHVYLCTSRPGDFKVGTTQTTAAAALGWAIKWIAAFELWINGDISDRQFSGHTI